MSDFDIHPPERFAGSSAAIRRPKEISCFSYDNQHRFHLDESSLRYYYPARIGADLSGGFDAFEKLDDTADDHLDGLLSTIMALEKETSKQCEADFITWRGMMTKIMVTPCSDFGGFEMNATLFQVGFSEPCMQPTPVEAIRVGVNLKSFIEENHDYKLAEWAAQRSQKPRPGNQSQELMSFWGYKFETLSLMPGTWDATSRDYIEGREDQVVNNSAQYCSVVRTGFGKSKLVIGGEVDAIWDCKPENRDDPINWVELKTSEEILQPRDQHKFERKLLKFWAQSFLLGVPKIIVGFRSKNGILRAIEELETKSIPAIVRRGSRSWDGNLCINFTAEFLEWLKATIKSDGIWRIRRREKSHVIEVFRLEESECGGILTPEFVEWRRQLAARTTISS
ncbi:MAG: decapping endonuclease targeting mRNA [Trichoglossum hirsutum]|nr:MAG: decapping endonuclease targeting mRNA [Trichoglossum hirsutum]